MNQCNTFEEDDDSSDKATPSTSKKGNVKKKVIMIGKPSEKTEKCKCKSCETNRKLKEHLEPVYECISCEEQVKDQMLLTAHYMEKHSHMGSFVNNLSFVCKVCNYSCIHKYVLQIHMRHHSGERPYECHICDHSTQSRSSLRQHIQTHNKNNRKKKHKCELCKFQGVTKTELKGHIVSKHTEKMNFSCNLCNYKSKTKRTLLLHLRLSHKKSYKCLHCSFKTSLQQDFDKHLKSHKGFCNICEYKSKSSEDLSKHKAKYHPRLFKKYECNECSFKFYTKRALRTHIMMSCKEDKVYRCDNCDFGCDLLTLLKDHIRRVHSSYGKHDRKTKKQKSHSESEPKLIEETGHPSVLSENSIHTNNFHVEVEIQKYEEEDDIITIF